MFRYDLFSTNTYNESYKYQFSAVACDGFKNNINGFKVFKTDD